ncbi:MAG TPA: hypothetical protein VN680_04210 [Burkholderiaceae bacterium]|jgi:hypothetical protein|nr:hypothetical protein [Burkholderiaceae bacterium]
MTHCGNRRAGRGADYLGELVFMVALILCGWLLLDQIWSRQLEEEPAPRRRVSA